MTNSGQRVSIEEAAAAVGLKIYSSGNVKGEGLESFTRKEFGEIVNKLQ